MVLQKTYYICDNDVNTRNCHSNEKNTFYNISDPVLFDRIAPVEECFEEIV